MDYATVEDLKTYLHITGTAHDALLADLITRASRLIDDHCGRWFGTVSQTRTYDAVGLHLSGRLLLLDADLYSLTSIQNGDGATITPADVILRPLNWPPYFGVSLKQGSGFRWGYTGDPEGAITVTGQWGFNPAVPDAVEHSALRLAAWLYRQRDTGGEGAQIEMTDHGVAVAPPRLPRDVVDMLSPYVKLRIKVLA